MRDIIKNSFSTNTANSNGYNGFYLYGSSNSNTFTKNTANSDTAQGFNLTSSSSKNTLNGNTANYNSRNGYYDSSTGSGKAGTANFYTFDVCGDNGRGGSSPSGLCPSFVSLSPSSGLGGSSVTIAGANFIASHGLTTAYDGSSTGMPTSCSTNSTGGISSGCAFAVPSPKSGPHTVSVSDGTNTPTAIFTVLGCGSTITTSTTLNENIGPCSASGLVIGANGITLNCAGYTVSGTSSNAQGGVSLSGKTKVTVENCKVTGFRYGFYLHSSSSSNTFIGNNAANNSYCGFYLTHSSSDTFIGNNAANNSFCGFYLAGSSSKNILDGNTASFNWWFGFFLAGSSSKNTLSGNTATNESNGFGISSSSSNTLSGNTAIQDGSGFYLDRSSDNAFIGNTADGNSAGFYIFGSSNSNAFIGNTADGNSADGFYLFGSSNSNAFIANRVTSPGFYGIYDGTTGKGTSGTANFYTSDTCSGIYPGEDSSPLGLC